MKRTLVALALAAAAPLFAQTDADKLVARVNGEARMASAVPPGPSRRWTVDAKIVPEMALPRTCVASP